jgi:hypothetical protein
MKCKDIKDSQCLAAFAACACQVDRVLMNCICQVRKRYTQIQGIMDNGTG